MKTVLLDMDGTLLDLHFDTFFWQQYLPEKWADIHNIDIEHAKNKLYKYYQKKAGTLTWYCLDFWSEYLQLDILTLKKDVEYLIKIRPTAKDFLKRLSVSDYEIIMVTNAHEKLIDMKMRKTKIDVFFDGIVSSHALGAPKESLLFWEKLDENISFNPQQTLFIDDTITILRTARLFGVKNLLSIAKPNSQQNEQNTEEFQAVYSFQDLLF